MPGNSQKFIARNRAPRVQIEYDVELYGAEKKVQLPFVMGVMSDLAGKSEEPQPAIADRKFLEIDVDNFDARMKAMKPRVAFAVPNTLTGEGSLAVDLTFEGMDDFTPAAIARRVEPLRVLLEARTQLSNLLTYMDGKSSAEALIEQVLQDPALLTALAAGPAANRADATPAGYAQQPVDSNGTLATLRDLAPPPETPEDGTAAALDALRMVTAEVAETDTATDALATLRDLAPPPETPEDGTAAALDALRMVTAEVAETDTATDALATLRDLAPPPETPEDGTAAALDALRMVTAEVAETDTATDALATLRDLAPPPETPEDGTAAALDALRMVTAEVAEPDTATDALATLRDLAPPPETPEDGTAAALDALRMVTAEVAETDTATDALATLRDLAPPPETPEDGTAAALDALRMVTAEVAETDTATDALATLRDLAPPPETPEDGTAAALDALRMVTAEVAEPDTATDALATLRDLAPPPETPEDGTAAALDALRMVTAEVAETDTATDALATLRDLAPPPETPEDGTAAALDALRMVTAEVAEPDTATDALATLRDLMPPAEAAEDGTASALDALRMVSAEAAETDTATDALATLRDLMPPAEAAEDGTASALDALRMVTAEVAETDTATNALATLRDLMPPAEAAEDGTASALDALRIVTAEVAEPESATDPLAALRDLAPPPETPGDATASALDALRMVSAEVAEPESATDPLAALRDLAPPPETPGDATASALDALRMESVEGVEPDTATDPLAGLDDLLAPSPEPEADDPLAGLDDLLAPSPEPVADDPLAGLDDLLAPSPEPVADDPLAGLDDLLAPSPEPVADDPLAGLEDLLAPSPEPVADDPLAELEAQLAPSPEPLADDPLAGLEDLLAPSPEPVADDPLAGLEALLAPSPEPLADDPLAGLEDLLAPSPEPVADDPLAGLEALLAPSPESDPFAGIEAILADTTPAVDDDDPLAGLEALLASSAVDAELDDPLAGLEALLAAPSPAATKKEDALVDLDDILAAPKPKARPVSGFGRITAPAPSAERLYRPVFRIAILGDFTGRAARGEIAIGDNIARRRAIPLDIDTVEDVIDALATTLVLPIGPEGRGIAVPLKGLDSLHPDELVQNVAVFDELKGLRQRLSTPSMAARAVAEMQGWAAAHDTIVQPTAKRSAASAVPADLHLSDFQRLIGDREGRLSTPSPVADLIGQIVGPYVVPGPNPEAKALRAAVDEAMSHAMRLILHHPEFQAIEAQWRSLDLLARRIETDEKLELVLFDISAEEFAADLTAGEDLSKSGLWRMLNAPLQDEGAIGFSAVFGLYSFQETPPHAALLGRMGAIAGHLQLPFFASMTADFLDTAKRDRHPLVVKAWDDLRRDPAAAWLGLASPRFLLRRPYGASSEPVDAFDFEEFTLAEGLSGMLWANPVVLVAVLLAETWKKGKGKIVLGKTMSMGDMPYHVVEDQHGDQVALPCTERNVTTEKTELAVSRGFMPVVSMKGRDVVRLASFQSLAGKDIAGPWLDEPPVRLPDGEGATFRATLPAGNDAAAQSMEDELDALLAGFGADAAPVDPGAIDADLAALLEGL